MTPREAAAIAGVSRRTITNWILKDPSLAFKIVGRLNVNDRHFIGMITNGTGDITLPQAIRYGATRFGHSDKSMALFHYLLDNLVESRHPGYDGWERVISFLDLSKVIHDTMITIINGSNDDECKVHWRKWFNLSYRKYFEGMFDSEFQDTGKVAGQ